MCDALAYRDTSLSASTKPVHALDAMNSSNADRQEHERNAGCCMSMRVQVSKREKSGQRPTLSAIVRQLWREQGMKGFTRGLTPRIANAAM